MKKVLTKMGYMAFGSLLTLIGYHFGNIDNNSANAQRIFNSESELVVRAPSPIQDEIRCRRLVIVGKDNTPRIKLETDLFDRGTIGIYNEDETLRMFLGVMSDDNGVLEIIGKESGGPAAR